MELPRPVGRGRARVTGSASAALQQHVFEGFSTTVGRRTERPGLNFRPAASRAHGRPMSAPQAPWPVSGVRGCGATERVTPRQACPRPNGFGRNLRSKTRWFTGFCNSHQVSHFATFFIDARAEISVAESRLVYIGRPCCRPLPANGADCTRCFVSIPWRGPRRGYVFCRAEWASAQSPDIGLRGRRHHPLPAVC